MMDMKTIVFIVLMNNMMLQRVFPVVKYTLA